MRPTSVISALLLVVATALVAGAAPAAADTSGRVASTQTFAAPSGFSSGQPVQDARDTGEMLVDLIRDADRTRQVALLDVDSGQYTLVSPTSPGSHALGISADGQTLAYAVEQHVGYSTTSHVFVLDRSTGVTRQVDVDEAGAPVAVSCSGNGPSALTPDGRFLAFTCDASRTYVRNLRTGQLFAAPGTVVMTSGYALLDDGDRLLFSSPGTASSPDYSNLTDGFVYAWRPSTGAITPVADCRSAACYFQGASGDGHLLAYVSEIATVDTAHVWNLTTGRRWTGDPSQRGWAASVAHDGSTALVWEGYDGVHRISVVVGDPDHGFDGMTAADGVPAGQVPTWLDDEGHTIWAWSDQGATAWRLVLDHDTLLPPEISYSLDAHANQAGWFDAAVDVSFDCEGGIPPTTCTDTVHVGEGADQVVSGSVVDVEGNTAAANVVLDVDTTAPTETAPTTSSVAFSPSLLNLTTTVADNLSGVTRAEYFVDQDPGAGNGAPMTITGGVASAVVSVTAPLVKHVIGVRTQDVAGNWSVTRTVTVLPLG